MSTTDIVLPDPGTSGATFTLRLPWLTAHVTPYAPRWEAHLRGALAKFAAGDTTRGSSMTIDVVAPTEATLERAREVAAAPTLEYQFVQGHATADDAWFATADGSLAHLSLDARRLVLAPTDATVDAPYSTWADFVAAPLAELWRADGCVPLHAAAVSMGPHTVLIVGASGSGKTTTSLALVDGGGTWRADDKVLLARHGQGLGAISLYRNTNVAPATIDAFAVLAFARHRPPLDETNDKRACWLEEASPRVDLSSFHPTAIVFPSISPAAQSRLVRLDTVQALLRLAAQSPMSPVAARARVHHDLLCHLASRVPAFALEAGSDVLTQPASVSHLVSSTLDDVSRGHA